MTDTSYVVLLHAHARSPRSMAPLARRLERDGHVPLAIGYPSRTRGVHACAEHVVAALHARFGPTIPPFACVGHSMGGVVYRTLPAVAPTLRITRAVTLGSPLRGAAAARVLGRLPRLSRWVGPAMAEFSAALDAPEPPLPAPTLCIAGTRSLGLLPGAWLLRLDGREAPNDSTVRVEEALSQHADKTLQVDVAHPLLPSAHVVHQAVAAYLAPRTVS